MNTQKIKHRVSRKRARAIAKRRMLLLLAALLFITIGTIIFGSIFSKTGTDVKAHDSSYTYYKSIVIKEGDTLWSIAKEYRTDESSSTEEYVQELREINNLTSDTIHAGQHLVIAYNDSEYR